MKCSRPLSVSAAALVCGLVSGISGQTPARQAPAFRSEIDLVTVDVTVLNRGGEPLVSLTAEDFTLLVDGKPRPIVSVRSVRAGSAAPTPAQAQPAPTPAPAADAAQRRLFVLVVDRDHVHAGEGQQMLEAGARFIDALPPEDRVALWTLPDSSEALRFNDDHEALKKRLRLAVGTYRAPYGPWIVGRGEAILADDGRPGALQAIINRECYKQPQTCPQEVEVQARETARDARQRAEATLSGLGHIVDALGGVEDKHLVLITGGPSAPSTTSG